MDIAKTYPPSFFSILGIFASFNLTKSIWNSYEKYAISQIDENIYKIKGLSYFVNELSYEQAESELKNLTNIISILNSFKETIIQIDDEKFLLFKKKSLFLINLINELYLNLNEIEDIHSSYKISAPVLATDWDSEADKHWDEY